MMKANGKILILSIAILSTFLACAKAQSDDKTIELKDKKILIVYLSRTQNTKAVAEIIQQKVGGDLLALELESPYPQNYQAHVDQVAEENRTGFLPPLKTKIDSVQNYDIVFIGFPTWGMKLPPPFKTFLTETDLGGKTIIPFNTHAGYGAGSGFESVAQLCPDSKILEGISLEGGRERDGIMFVMEGKKKTETSKAIENWLVSTGFKI